MGYQVKAGDTLSAIAKRYGVSVADIVKANPQIKNPDHIETGWMLRMPMPANVPGKSDGFSSAPARTPTDQNRLNGALNNAATAPVTSPPAAPVANVAAPNGVDLRATASKAEAQVMSQATQLAQTSDPAQAKALQGKLQDSYGQWQTAVRALVNQGQLDAPEVKSFASKTEQAAMLSTNLPPEARGLTGSAYRDAVQGQIQKNCVAVAGQTAADVTKANPLLQVPSLAGPPSVDDAKAKGVPTTSVTINGKTGQVRKDVVMVYCPGVVRTGNEFDDMRAQALVNGFASTRAETGTFIDPEENAKAIATAVKQAKDLVGNPDAKVILVGYSQGNTNLFAFMRDKDNQYGNLTKDVVGIHDVHSAARGSQEADAAFAIGQMICSDQPLTSDQKKLVDAYSGAMAKAMHLPPAAGAAVELQFKVLHEALKGVGLALKGLNLVAGPAMKALGLQGLSDEQLNKKLLGFALQGTQVDGWLAQHGGAAGKLIAKAMDPLMDALEKSPAAWLRDPMLSPMFQKYVSGGLESLTTDYGTKLMTDPKLQAALKNVVILNSNGAIPDAREQEMVPPSQRVGYAFFKQLGMDNDYQVSLPNQMLSPVVTHAVDLPTDAIGHWGVTGVTVPVDHPEKFFDGWSPAGMTNAVLTTFHQMGVV